MVKERHETSSTVQVLIPCFNESKSIEKVITDFRKYLPWAEIIVGDNNSTDDTFVIAEKHADKVISVQKKGKGEVMRTLFQICDADVIVMCDGDDTYDLRRINDLIDCLEFSDICIGWRKATGGNSFRKFHMTGNNIFQKITSKILQLDRIDVFSGLRVMSYKFVKSMPLTRKDFAIETEINLHAAILGAGITQIEIDYRPRAEGSSSKLNKFRDGSAIFSYLLSLALEFRPLVFFLAPGLIANLISVLLLVGPIDQYFLEGKVLKTPSLIAGMSFFVFGQLLCALSIILNHIRKFRIEGRKLAFLSANR